MAFVKCRPKIVKEDTNKLILWENFSPQGQPFSKTVDVNEYDLRSNCTFFCDMEVFNGTEETLISIGREISSQQGEAYPRSIFHFSGPVDDNLQLYMSARSSSGPAKRVTTPISVSVNRIRIALNSNGLAVSGVVQSPNYFSDFFVKLYSDLTRPLEIGSTYGNHSNEYYHKISLIKEYLSLQEMRELTAL